MNAALLAHLRSGSTHICRCWSLTRTDGVVLGFTDHDRPLNFEGIAFQPESGLTARALVSASGLSVNNSEAVGALSSDAITEADIAAGRYDGAAVVLWHVCWDDVAARQIRFRGTLGEITRSSSGFQAELLGLTEALNRPLGRSYLKTCSAVLGDGRCRFDTGQAAYHADVLVQEATDGQSIVLAGLDGFADGWFADGHLKVKTGSAAGLSGVIKTDAPSDNGRAITLWAPIPVALAVGDALRLVAGCDKSAATCRTKFANFVNFQGFPDIPGDDWLVSVPRSGDANTGGSLTR